MNNIPDVLKFAKELQKNIQKKAVRIDDKYYPKADAYSRMIIDRAEIIITDTIRLQRFMDDIQDGLKKLNSFGVVIPSSKPNENPLK